MLLSWVLLYDCAPQILGNIGQHFGTWWRHNLKTFSTLLTLCEANPPATSCWTNIRYASDLIGDDAHLAVMAGKSWLSTKQWISVLLTWINFNPSMDKWLQCRMKLPIHSQTSTVEVWEWISSFNPYCTCDYLSMLGLRLIHVSKRVPERFLFRFNSTHCSRGSNHSSAYIEHQ